MKQRYVVTFTLDRHGADLAAVLDMLRYDGATVVTWERAGEGRNGEPRFRLTLSADRPSFERWQSFGLHPEMKW